MTDAQFAVRRAGPSNSALLMLLEEVARAANEADSVEEAGGVALRAVCRFTEWPAGHLCVPDPDEPSTLRSSGIWALPDVGAADFAALRRVTAVTRFPQGVGLPGMVATSRTPEWSADVVTDPGFIRSKGGVDLGIMSAMALPVLGRAGVVAVLEFFSPVTLTPDEDLLRVLSTIGAQLGRVADRVSAQRDLEAGAHRLEEIIETSAEAFVEMDADGMILAWNAAAERMFGLPRDLALGQSLAETIVPPHLRDAHRSGMARFLATGDKSVIGTRIEVPAWRPDTGEFPVELAVWARHDGDTWTFNAFLHDIRDRRRGDEALREALERERANAARLQALDQAKDNFVATVSHELRTPLTSMSGYLELLLDGDAGPVPVHQQRMLETMARNAGRLRALIEDLLLVNQMDAGNLHLDLEPTALPGLVDRAVSSVTGLAEARSQRIEVGLEPGLGRVLADATHLERATRALLTNAVKFSPDGAAIRVLGSRVAGEVELAVVDEGVGIEEEDLPRLFDRFFRTGQATRAAVQGAGLGLTIARRIVEEHGGTITVCSKPGRGSTFRIRLPACT
jgi:PAS domain S-box-containing protein